MANPKQDRCDRCRGTGKTFNIRALRALRERSGVSAVAVAGAIGMSKQKLYAIEHGTGRLTSRQAKAYIEACG